MDLKSDFGVKMGRNRKPCAACQYLRRKCPPECPFAPFFPSHTGGEDFRNVVKVFGATNFTKLIKSAEPHQCLAAKTMIIEARARKYDPVHGLAGIVETLLQQLNNLTTKLAFLNQQNQFHRRLNSVCLQQGQPHFRPNEAKRASSSPLRAAAVPSPSRQDTGSSLTQNDEFSPYSPAAQVDYNDIKPFASLIYPTNNLGDTAIAKMKHHNKESDGLEDNFNHFRGGVVFKQSKDAEGLTKTFVQEYKDVVQNSENPVNLGQESKATVKCSMDADQELAWSFIQENKADVKKCTDYSECTIAKFSHHIKEEPEICSLDYMENNKKGCAACKYHKRKCLPECPFAPIFPGDKEKDFQNVRRVFGASNFIKLMKSAAKSQQHLAAKTMIIEANARVSDPVHGLGVFAVILLKQLDYVCSELDLVNKQTQFHRQRR